jgi:hypothetical protein
MVNYYAIRSIGSLRDVTRLADLTILAVSHQSSRSLSNNGWSEEAIEVRTSCTVGEFSIS